VSDYALVTQIFRGVTTFLLADFVVVAIVIVFPQSVMPLPNALK